jgi:hypothetical protein
MVTSMTITSAAGLLGTKLDGRSCGVGTLNLDEAGVEKEGQRTPVELIRGDGTAGGGVNRVGLDDPGPAGEREFDGSLQQGAGHSAAPVPDPDDKAGDGPDLVVQVLASSR